MAQKQLDQTACHVLDLVGWLQLSGVLCTLLQHVPISCNLGSIGPMLSDHAGLVIEPTAWCSKRTICVTCGENVSTQHLASAAYEIP